MNEHKSLNQCKYLVQYHLIWCPKFRYNVLKGNVEEALKRILVEICNKYEYEILELEVMVGHIHIFVSAKPTIAPTDIVRTLKSITAIQLFKEFPALRKFYSRFGSLWSKGYFVSTIGKVSAETIQKYIEVQKTKEYRR